jgi:ubiquinone/menaquinone biosynthesis C-methylase UbiE
VNEISWQAPERSFSGPIGKEYEKLKLICPEAADMSRRVGEFLADWVKRREGRLKVVELGCGTGITTTAILSALGENPLVAVDPESTMLAQARVNLFSWMKQGQLTLVEDDALSYLKTLPDASQDAVVSAYTLHNFVEDYRNQVLREIHRVLLPGGLFVNGDRYALDDRGAHTRQIQEEARRYFAVFGKMGRIDLLEEWIVHLFGDESPDRVMRLSPSLQTLSSIGFEPASVHYRHGVNALVSAEKPVT